MVAAKTCDDLVTEAKDAASVPDADGRFGTASGALELGILRLASNVLRTTCADLLVGSRSQRWVSSALGSIVSGTYLYAIPERALAAGVSDIIITDGTDEWSAPEIAASDAWRFINLHGGWDSPYAYCWRDDDIELLPHPTSSAYSLRVKYPRGLLRLVRVSDCARVASKGATTITTAATVPSAWTATETLDIVRGGPNGQPRDIDLAGTLISGTSITIAAGVPSTVVAGDYVCLDGETCIPPVPDAVWPVLVSGTALRVARVFGDAPGVADLERQTGEDYTLAKKIVNPRSRGASQKIVARGYGTRRGWR